MGLKRPDRKKIRDGLTFWNCCLPRRNESRSTSPTPPTIDPGRDRIAPNTPTTTNHQTPTDLSPSSDALTITPTPHTSTPTQSPPIQRTNINTFTRQSSGSGRGQDAITQLEGAPCRECKRRIGRGVNRLVCSQCSGNFHFACMAATSTQSQAQRGRATWSCGPCKESATTPTGVSSDTPRLDKASKGVVQSQLCIMQWNANGISREMPLPDDFMVTVP